MSACYCCRRVGRIHQTGSLWPGAWCGTEGLRCEHGTFEPAWVRNPLERKARVGVRLRARMSAKLDSRRISPRRVLTSQLTGKLLEREAATQLR
jgi:hypothetical protein